MQIKAPVIAIKLMKMGNTFSMMGKIWPTISPENAMIAPMPIICWEIDRLKAVKRANLFVCSCFGCLYYLDCLLLVADSKFYEIYLLGFDINCISRADGPLFYVYC